MKNRLAVLAGIAIIAHSAVVHAQDPPDQGKSVFDQVIPRPSGRNGYEELVMAAGLASQHKLLNAIQQVPSPGPTLSAIRKTLADPDLIRARELLRLGLSKPVESPRAFIDDETLLPEFAGFRQLARMLAFQLYVDCADGRMNRAIDTLRDCLRFGYVIQTDSLISGLVGVAIDAIAMRRFQDHLEQLSAPDCDRLLVIVREWLRLPDPLITVFNAERRGVHSILQKYRSDPDKLIQVVGADPNSEEYRKAQSVLAMLKSDAGGVGAAFDRAGARMNAHFDRMTAEMQKPFWERQDLPSVEDNSPAGQLCGMLAPVYAQVSDRYAREQSTVQMLGVYAAVRRYRWENQVLPPSLESLKLGGLVVDPFTGKPFSYKIISERDFELGSIGPLDRSPDSPTAGARTPVTLPMKRP